MGIDLVVTVDYRVSEEDRLLVTKLMGRTDQWWTPYWGDEEENGRTYTFCYPGDRYVGLFDDEPYRLNNVDQLAHIWGAFTLVLKKASYKLYFLPDYDIPTSYDEPVTREYMRKLARIAAG
jgi:hypothetical protein